MVSDRKYDRARIRSINQTNVQAVVRSWGAESELRHLAVIHNKLPRAPGVTEAQLARALIRYRAKKKTAPNGNSEAVGNNKPST